MLIRLSFLLFLLYLPANSLADNSPARLTEYANWLNKFSENQGKPGLILFHHEKGEAIANSCEDLWQLSDLGYYGQTQFAINREMEFKSACIVLELLDKVKPSQTSYLQNFHWTEDIIRNLPKDLAESLDTLNDSGIRAEFEKRKKFLDVYEIHTSDEGRYSLEIIDTHRFEMIYDERASDVYQIIALGDFNGDGIEDMLLTWAKYPGGSWHLYGHEVLTRLEPNGDLVHARMKH